jgi:hypothetical protein
MLTRQPMSCGRWLAVALTLSMVAPLSTQATSTQAEVDARDDDPNAQSLERLPCNKITWLLESERTRPGGPTNQPIHYALGSWGRGFIEGAILFLPNSEALAKQVGEFGLTVDVTAVHIASYCEANPTRTPFDAIQALLLKALS